MEKKLSRKLGVQGQSTIKCSLLIHTLKCALCRVMFKTIAYVKNIESLTFERLTYEVSRNEQKLYFS